MLPRVSIKDHIGVDVAVSGKMETAIELWKDMYQNTPPWLGEANALPTNIPATLAEEFARLILTEFEFSVDGGAMGEFLDAQMKKGLVNLRRKLERMCASGGMAVKPYVEFDAEGKPSSITIDFVDADRFFPTEYDSNGNVISAIFVQSKRDGDYLYTRLEYNEFSNNTMTITNKAFRSEKIVSFDNDDDISVRTPLDEEVPLNVVDEWAGLSEKPVVIENIEKPLFAYIKVPKDNTIDSSSPLGASVYARAIELIKEADIQFGRMMWEFEATEAAIDVSAEYLETDKQGRPVLPKGKERLYRSYESGLNGNDIFSIYSPQIRESELYSGFNRILKRIEWNVGLAYGTISDPEMIEKTATEIKTSKQRSYTTISEFQTAIDAGLKHLFDSMKVLVVLYGMGNPSDAEISITWGDGVLEDTEVEYQRRWAMVMAGKLKVEKFFEWYFGVSEEEASEMIPQLQEFPSFE